MSTTTTTGLRRIGGPLLDQISPFGPLGRRAFWGRAALSLALVALPILAVAAWRLWSYLAVSGAHGATLFFTFEARLIVTHAWPGAVNAWALLAIPVLLPSALRRLREAGLPAGLGLLTFGTMVLAWLPVMRSEFLIALQVPTLSMLVLVPVLGLLPPARPTAP